MKSWLMIVVVVLAVASAFLFFDNNSSVGLAPPKYKAGLADLTANISINNVVNNSINGSVQFLINYNITYKNIGNVVSQTVDYSSWGSMACISGPGYGGGGGSTLPALNPNQITTYQSYFQSNCYGTWSAYAAVDTIGTLTELNETNNNASISIPI